MKESLFIMKNKNIRMAVSISLNLLVVVFGVFLIFTAGSKAYSFGHNIFDEQAIASEANAREVSVTIADGVSAKQLAETLYDKGLINDKVLFYIQVSLSDYKGKFVGGTYTLSTAMTPTQMMQVLSNSKSEEDGNS
jgi:UPF0755 protein